MASVHDVAAYILHRLGPLPTMKLQKLCYYAQGHSLAWDGHPLFPEEIQAWANGPVIHDLFARHRGKFGVSKDDPFGDPDALTQDERETVDAVLDAYGHLTGHELSMLTHKERPWVEARGDLPHGARSHNTIDLDVMQEYFDAVIAQEQA
jgi:uncharacterized phage-associated protein